MRRDSQREQKVWKGIRNRGTGRNGAERSRDEEKKGEQQSRGWQEGPRDRNMDGVEKSRGRKRQRRDGQRGESGVGGRSHSDYTESEKGQ